MGINKKYVETENKLSKQNLGKYCRASKLTIVFSFKHMVKNELYSFAYFNKYKSNLPMLFQLQKKLASLSELSYDDLNAKNKKSGSECLNINDIEDKSLLNELCIEQNLSRDKTIYIIRFNSQKSRIIATRGTKCGRIMHILALDFGMNAYSH